MKKSLSKAQEKVLNLVSEGKIYHRNNYWNLVNKNSLGYRLATVWKLEEMGCIKQVFENESKDEFRFELV